MPPWQDTPWKLYSTPYVGTTDIPASTIRVIPLSQGCQGPSPNEDLDVKLHQALLIEAPKPIFPDRMLLPEYFRYPDASYDMKRYLVLQGFFRRSTDPKSTSSQAYAVDLFRLIGPTFVRQPLQVGSTFIAPGSVSAFWEVYPIDNITQSFKVMYCNFEDPTFILLNFSGVTSFQARYEIAQGLIAN